MKEFKIGDLIKDINADIHKKHGYLLVIKVHKEYYKRSACESINIDRIDFISIKTKRQDWGPANCFTMVS